MTKWRRCALLGACIVALIVPAGGATWAANKGGAAAVGTLVPLPKPLAKASKVDAHTPLRYAFSRVETSYDPASTLLHYESGILYDTLLITTPNKELTPGLATKYTVSADGKQVTFTLRDDAFFGDNSRVDANAVKMTIERTKTKPGALNAGILTNVASVDVVDARNVRFNLTNPDATLPYVMAGPAGQIMNPKYITSNADVSKGPAGVGSTPYDVKEFTPGVRVVFEKRSGGPKYWDPAAFPHDRIEITAANDAITIGNGLATNQWDFALWNVPEEQVRSVVPNHNYIQSPADSVQFIGLRDTRVPLNVRQAIVTAADRKADITSTPNCDTYASQMVRKGSPGYIKGYDPFKHSVEKAKSLLAGATPEIEMVFAPTLPTSNGPALVYEQQLKAAGIKVNMTPFSINDAISQFTGGQRDMLSLSAAGQPDIALLIQQQFFASYRLAGPTFRDALQAKLTAANTLPLGSKERDAALQDLQKTAFEYAAFVPMCHLKVTFVAKKNVLGIDTNNPLQFGAVMYPRYVTMVKVK